MADQPDAGPGGRERLVDAIAQYAADRVDNAFPPVKQRWEIRGMFNPAAASDQLDRLQEWLRELVQRPLEDTSAQLGLAPAAAEAADGIGANIVVAPLDRAAGDLTKVIDIVGIVGGTALGMHPIALACLKHLLHTEFRDMVAKAVTSAFDGLVVGSKELPMRFPGDLRPPGSASPQPHEPAPMPPPAAPDRPETWPASPAQRPSNPPQPPRAPGPPSPKPWHRGGPGISGPGGP
jgi:hypothetical protein